MKVEQTGGVLELVLDHPERLNALDLAEWSAILHELRAAEDDDHVRVVVIRAEGPVFCAGNDIKETRAFRTKGEARHYFLDVMLPTLSALSTSRLPIVAEVAGAALGGGLELLQYCDVVIASKGASFGLPETGIGLWATVHLATSAFVGDRRVAQYMALTGERLSAARALEAQLISEVVPAGQLTERVGALARTMAAAAPDAMARSKRYANSSLSGQAIEASRRALSELIDQTIFEDEARSGMTAFVERRTPVFDRG